MDEQVRAPADVKGAFFGSLVRNNRKIREDRAVAILESAQMIFKRTVEDLELKIKQLRRERENMLDLSPDNATSLVLAADFDAAKFVEKEVDVARKIRDNEILLELLKERYRYLFEGEPA